MIVSDDERQSYPPYEMDFVRVRLSPECRDLGESGDHRIPPEWYGDGWASLIERYHAPEWDGVVGQIQKRLVDEDPEEKHPYLIQCIFPNQAVRENASAWFAAGELVETAHVELTRWIPDPPRLADLNAAAE